MSTNNYRHTEWCSCGERFEKDEKFCWNCGKERTFTTHLSTMNANPTESCSCGEPFLLDEIICFKCGKRRPHKPLIPNNALIKNSEQAILNNTTMETLRSNHVCPSCGREMEYGHIYSDQQMRWTDSDRKWFFRSQKINDNASRLFHFSSENRLASYRCTACRIMLINY